VRPITPCLAAVWAAWPIVERDVQPAEGADRLVQRGLHGLTAGHVAPDHQRTPALVLDQPGGLPIVLVGDVGDETAAPADANATAVGRPMPLAAPVTKATLVARLASSLVATIVRASFP
jgi:hypothetical protein